MPAEFIENRRFRQWPFSTEQERKGGASCTPVATELGGMRHRPPPSKQAHSEVCSLSQSRPITDSADWSVHDPTAAKRRPILL